MGNGLSLVPTPCKNGIAAKIGYDKELELDLEF
jgi:hypothetical protein